MSVDDATSIYQWFSMHTRNIITYRRQFGDDSGHCGQEINDEKLQIIMGVMGRDQEEDDWHRHEVFFRRCVLVSVVDLLPHVEIIVGTSVEVEGNPAHPVEHQV